jgi:hypothetical protein
MLMSRSLKSLASLLLAVAAVALAYDADLAPFGTSSERGEARQSGGWGAGWLAVTPSRLVAVDVISL